MGFVKQLYKMYVDVESGPQQPPKYLRNKNVVDPTCTDRELFSDMSLGDCWGDASIAEVYVYLRGGKYLTIPASWQNAIEAFDAELHAKAASYMCSMCFASASKASMCGQQVDLMRYVWYVHMR